MVEAAVVAGLAVVAGGSDVEEAIVALEESVWLVPLDEQAAITIPVVINAGNNRDLTGPARNSDLRRAFFTVHPTNCSNDARVASLDMELTVLGSTVRHAIEHVEVFPAPEHLTSVTFSNDELSSMCPVTKQPDLSNVVIEYVPDEFCVESKSLKLYLWGFRDREVFAEALAAEIAGEIMLTASPRRVTVTLTQRPRGGIELQAVAERQR